MLLPGRESVFDSYGVSCFSKMKELLLEVEVKLRGFILPHIFGEFPHKSGVWIGYDGMVIEFYL